MLVRSLISEMVKYIGAVKSCLIKLNSSRQKQNQRATKPKAPAKTLSKPKCYVLNETELEGVKTSINRYAKLLQLD